MTDILNEHKNFPYQVLKKSTIMFLDEIGMAFEVGYTGVMLSLDFMTDNPFDEFHPYLEAISACRKSFDQAAGTFGCRNNPRFWTGFTRDQTTIINTITVTPA